MKFLLIVLALLTLSGCISPTEPTPVSILNPKLVVNGVATQ